MPLLPTESRLDRQSICISIIIMVWSRKLIKRYGSNFGWVKLPPWRRVWFWCLVLLSAGGLWWAVSCHKVPDFPERTIGQAVGENSGQVLYYDTNGDGKDDYWQILNRQGRKVEILFDKNVPESDDHVRLDEIPAHAVPHFIIALDGVPYSLVKELYEQGHFRLFYPPSRLISCFPSMTDLAFNQMFGGRKPLAYEAEYFDREKNRIMPGNDVYLSGENADWARKLSYRGSFTKDSLAYLIPEQIFEEELRGIKEVLSKSQKDTVVVYSVATAGLGTRGGREGIIKYLRTMDRFCEQLVFERHGRLKITLLADHGHNMSGRGRVSFDRLLEEAGFRMSDRLESPRDVVTIKYGLVTYAAFFTARPDKVAEVVLADPATTFACYPQADGVVVQTLDAKALVREKGGNYSYTAEYGDPLLLGDIIPRLRLQGQVNERGFIDDRALFDATAAHIYPDPLRRIWQAFNGLVKKPADLIVCLKDGYCHGSKLFEVMIGRATSTHGSLNQLNSATFVLTMLGDLPAHLRLDEVMGQLEKFGVQGLSPQVSAHR